MNTVKYSTKSISVKLDRCVGSCTTLANVNVNLIEESVIQINGGIT